MFGMVYKVYDERKKVYTFTGYFGSRFYRELTKFSTKKKIDAMFIKVSMMKIEINKFFLLELTLLIDAIIKEGSAYDVNVNALKEIKRYIEEEVWTTSNYYNFDYDRIEEKMLFNLLPHQREITDNYIEIRKKFNYRGFLVDSYVGSGKTFTSMAIAEAVHSNKILILCPLPTLERVWVKSIRDDFYKTPEDYWVSNSTVPYNDERIVIVHYDYLPKMEHMLKYLKGKDTTIIIDEFHNFNEIKSKRSKLLLNAIDYIDSDNIVLLTGTPVKAVANELIPMFKVLDKDFNSFIEKRFSKIYKSPDSFFKSILPYRYKKYVVKIKKKVDDLPPLHTEYIPVKLKSYQQYTMESIAKQLKEYIENRKNELERDFDIYSDRYYRLYEKYKAELGGRKIPMSEFKDYEIDFNNVIKYYKAKSLIFYPDLLKRVNSFEQKLMSYMDKDEKVLFKEAKTIVKYLYLKIQGEALANVILKQRIACHRDMAKEFNYTKVIESTVKKTIVFSNYIDVCKAANDKCMDIGYRPVNVYGTDTKNLTTFVKEFTINEKVNPLITTFKSLSTGVPLIAANVIVVLDLPFRSYIYEQAIGRAHRIGQDKDVYVYILELDTNGEPNINSRNIDIITFFKKEVENITGYEVDVNLDGRNNGVNSSNESYVDLMLMIKEDHYLIGLNNDDTYKTIKKILEW